ncbi:MAG: glutaminyl-peptide cyclotransferase [Bacteroidales bacterium]
MRRRRQAYGFLLIALAGALGSCGPRNGSSPPQKSGAEAPAAALLSVLEEPASSLSLPLGSLLPLRLSYPDSLHLDSLHVLVGGKLQEALVPGEETGTPELAPGSRKRIEYSLSTGAMALGQSGLRVRLYFGNGLQENHSRQLTLLSDTRPVSYGYRVVRRYPHDEKAYTQGLEYEDGVLYEGTGEYGTSTLRKVDLETGEILKIRNLDAKLFGEGITLFRGRIYQLTYKAQVGFVYDKSSFEELQKVYYQNKEGWGLTHNEDELIMSDGTHVLYFLDPGMFTINRQMEVYDDQGKVDSLNELEYINGKIWANRYYTDEIVIIDPESGRVEGRIDLKGILPATERNPGTNVLNGIAWDKEADRIFVTGKNWPRLYHIEIQERP